jgi:hypothetical protein
MVAYLQHHQLPLDLQPLPEPQLQLQSQLEEVSVDLLQKQH